MALNFYKYSREFLLVAALLVAALMTVSDHVEAKEGVSDYVIEQFGKPPAIPKGPLSVSYTHLTLPTICSV